MQTIEKPQIEIPTIETFEHSKVIVPIDCEPKGKHFLSMRQPNADDIGLYLANTAAAEAIIEHHNGINLLPHVVLKAFMRQPSTRTGGSTETAMEKLGGSAAVISGSAGSSEAKGESFADSVLAFATQADILGIRAAEDFGPAFAAHTISKAYDEGKLKRFVPVINLGDGKNEHPTQTIGDLRTIEKHFGGFDGLDLAMVGDHERYRANHSLFLAAPKLGMHVTAVESPAAPVPQEYVDYMGDSLTRTDDLDTAMKHANALYVGRKPGEYKGESPEEITRDEILSASYDNWIVDNKRLQQMPSDSIAMHPWPRGNEMHPDLDYDPRVKVVEQMENMIPARMAVIALHLGKSLTAFR